MKKNSKILLLLDFDGTLAPIVDNPHKAALPPRTRSWLKALLNRKNIKVGIVTGRALADVQKRVGLKGVIYATNHGMEIHAGGRLLLNKGKRFCRSIAKLEKELLGALKNIPGVIIEMKGASLSVHYRKARSASKQRRVIAQTQQVLRGRLRKNGLHLTTGKMVLEVRPRGHWNKGKASLWILRHLAAGYLPVYFGDDMTDEDAFSALRTRGVTILIGKPRKTAAKYRLRSFLPHAASRYFR